MKTRIIHLTRFALAALTLAAVSSTSFSLHAAKPGGGGSAPAGTIYFYSPPYQGDGLDYSMKADGSQKTPIGITGSASPSGLSRGGKRWFLQDRDVAGKWESFAVSEDGATAVQLTDDPAMNISLDWTPVENANEAIIAGLSRRWNEDGTPDVASMGVYIATLRFDADGNVIGLDAPPTFLVSIGVVDPDGTGYLSWDSYSGFSFSPDLSRLVVDHYDATGLRIIDVATGAESPLVSGWARHAAWSPDGAKIAFVLPASSVPAKMDVVSPNGTGRATVFKARVLNEYLYAPTWSPDSAHLAFQLQSLSTYPWTDEVYRVSASGGKAVNLTADITVRAFLMGWR